MKVVITDYTFPDLAIEEEILRPLGHEIVAWKEKRSAVELTSLVADADAVITQFAPVNADVIANMQQARVIVRYGIGVDNVDLDMAKRRGIPVCNVPDYCIDEVADQTLAFLLAATRQVVSNTNRNRSGCWGLATPLQRMFSLRELTVGIVGFGRIGREVVARLLPFKCNILVHDPIVSPDDIAQAGGQAASLNDLIRGSDVISLHCPSTPQTRRMIRRETLAETKNGVILINVARGDLVDSQALCEALQSGQVGVAALDVFDPEPIPSQHPILAFDNVILASHIASCSVPAVRKLRETAAKLAALALRDDMSPSSLPNVVNGVGRDDG